MKSLDEMEEWKRVRGSTYGSRDFQDAESVRSGQSHVPSQPALLPPFQNPCGMLSRAVGMPSRNDGPPSIWDTRGVSGNVFCKCNGVFFSTLSACVKSLVLECIRTHITICDGVKAKHQFRIRDAGQDRQPEIHSSLVNEDFQRIMSQTNNDCRFQILILTNSSRQQRSLVGR